MDDNDKLIRKCFVNYLFPSIIAIIGGNISITIDNFVAGRFIGSEALAAMSMLNPLFYIFTMTGTLISAGSSTIVSVLMGKNKRENINVYFTLAAMMSIIIGTILSTIIWVFRNDLCVLLGAEGQTLTYMKQYCTAFIPGGVAIVATYYPLNYLRVDGKGKYGMAMFIIMAGLDIILDLIFVLGFNMQMYGMALATVLSSAISVIVIMPLLCGNNSIYRFVKISNVKEKISNIIVTGSPIALNNFYSVLRTIFINLILMSSGGTAGVTCYAFSIGIYTIANAIISGIAQTISPLIGVFRGEKDIVSIKKVMRIALRTGVITIMFFVVIISLLSNNLCKLFGIEQSMMEKASIALILCSISLIGVIINSIFMYYFMTMGRIKIANHISLLRGMILPVICTFLLSRVWGIKGVWAGFSVCEILTLLLIITETILICRKEKNTKGILLINDSNGKMLSFSALTNKESIIDCANKVSQFCEECELSPKQSMMISLSIEEILILMIEHVFKDNTKETIDSKIYVEKDDIVIRFRCGGKRFNPIEYYDEQVVNGEMDALSDCMGLMMIKKAAKDINYTTNLGMNNMIVLL